MKYKRMKKIYIFSLLIPLNKRLSMWDKKTKQQKHLQ